MKMSSRLVSSTSHGLHEHSSPSVSRLSGYPLLPKYIKVCVHFIPQALSVKRLPGPRLVVYSLIGKFKINNKCFDDTNSLSSAHSVTYSMLVIDLLRTTS